MALTITETDQSAFPDYGDISIAFPVNRVMRVVYTPDGGIELTEERWPSPYIKDYDAIPDNRPADWGARWPHAHWRVFTAAQGGPSLGRATVIWRTPGVDMLEGRDDLMVLWDIRVDPSSRGRGIGIALMDTAESFARGQGCRCLKVETQTINVPACRFYRKCGFTLQQVNENAYPGLPGETQLLWYKSLD